MAVTQDELNALLEIKQNPYAFITKILGVVPTKQQTAVLTCIHNWMKEGSVGVLRIAVKSGHGTGKSALLSWLMLWYGFTQQDCKIPCTAPSSPQLRSVLWGELRKWKAKLPQLFKDDLEILTDTVRFKNGNEAIARTVRPENPDALQGFHGTAMLFIVDEASGVAPTIDDVIKGAVTKDRSIVIYIGNPTRTTGTFFRIFNDPEYGKTWNKFTFSAADSENVGRAWLEQMQYEPENVYRVRVLGEFPKQDSDSLIAYHEIEEAMLRPEDEVDKSSVTVWGVDVAYQGNDSTVITKRHGHFILPQIMVRGFDPHEVTELVSKEYTQAQRKPQYIVVDAIGVGAGVYAPLRHRFGEIIRDGRVSLASMDERYFNKRAEMYARLRDELKYLSIPNDEMLRSELACIKYKHKGVSMILDSKDDMRKILMRSPDRADSLALTFFENYAGYDNDYHSHAGFGVKLGAL